MSEIDWEDPKMSEGVVTVQMVSQNNIDDVYGTLDGVLLKSSSISSSYYTDTRISATLDYVGSGWIRGSFLRILYSIPSVGYSRELGTFLATDDGATYKNGCWTTNLQLQSVGLYRMTNDIMPRPWSIASGASVRDCMHQILETSPAVAYIDSSTNDYTVSDTLVIDSGTSRLARLYALSDLASVRLDTDGHGRATIQNYVAPSKRTPVYTINLANANGSPTDGLTRYSDWLSMPNRAIVSYKYSKVNDHKKSETYEITGIADATNGLSDASRGYRISNFYTLSEMSPETEDEAMAIAKKRIETLSNEDIEWKLTVMYLPVHIGDAINLFIPSSTYNNQYSGTRHCFIKSIELKLDTMLMELTLKETSSNDSR